MFAGPEDWSFDPPSQLWIATCNALPGLKSIHYSKIESIKDPDTAKHADNELQSNTFQLDVDWILVLYSETLI